MSRHFKLWRDPFGLGFSLYKKDEIRIQPGITVLCGCNGSGKTTLLHNICEELKKDNIPYLYYSNLTEGGNKARERYLLKENIGLLATSACSSEGENIKLNLYNIVPQLGRFVKTGKHELYDSMNRLFTEREEVNTQERWILLDAIDSGLSLDMVMDIKKDLFELILREQFGNEVYILVSANEYEMAEGMPCLDVSEMEYVSIDSYPTYRSVILGSRIWKDERALGPQ